MDIQNLTNIVYVIAAVLFILDLKMLAHPRTAVRGNFLGALGMLLALVGIVYVRVFYGVRDGVFARLPLPNWVKPGIGGLLVAVMALFLPQVMGGGYGWLQLTLDGELPFKLLLLLLPAKILATSLTISSGGSGGVFAPSLIIGGVTGAVFAELMQRLAPAMAPATPACVLVGMGGFFAGVAKVPIASLIMVAEMSGSYTLLVPMMLASSVAFLLTRGVSIYEAQVPGRIDSPAHIGEFQIDVLNKHLTLAAEAILAQEGTLDKFVGDSAMAIFNAPEPHEDHTLRAVCAAVAMQQAIHEGHQQMEENERLFFGIGVAVGEAVVGNIGSDQLHNYTAIGDCVNYSCRLSDIAGPGEIYISAEAYERVKDHIEVKFMGDVQVKGRHAGEVYQVLSLKEPC